MTGMLRFVFPLLCFFSVPAVAQKTFSIAMSSEQTAAFSDYQRLPDSGLTIFGTISRNGTNGLFKEFYLTRLGADFTILKTQAWGDSAMNIGLKHTADINRGYLLSGMVSKSYSDSGAALIIKLDSNWNQVWALQMRIGTDDTRPEICMLLKDSSYLIGGEVKYKGTAQDDRGWLCKLDRNGNVIWCKTYKRGNSSFKNVEEDVNGNFYVTGHNSQGYVQLGGSVVLKLDPAGTIIWDAFQDDFYMSNGKLGPDGDLYVAGNTSSFYAMMFKMNKTTGAKLWTRAYSKTNENREAIDLAFDEFNAVYMPIYSDRPYYEVAKLDLNGQHIWTKRIHSTFPDGAGKIYYDQIKKRMVIISPEGYNGVVNQHTLLNVIDTFGSVCMQDITLSQVTSMPPGSISPITSTTVASASPRITFVTVSSRAATNFYLPAKCTDCDSLKTGFTVKYDSINVVRFSNTFDSTKVKGLLWRFGDGQTSTDPNPVHTYSAQGTYQARLIVRNGNGICTDSITKNIYIEPLPKAEFNVANGGCVNKTFVFNRQNTNWEGTYYFGNGDSTKELFPWYKYSLPGAYQVKLVVKNKAGFMDSVTKTVNVHPLPAASFSTKGVCEKDTVTLTSTSTITQGQIKTYKWTINNAIIKTDTQIKYVFQQYGGFVKLHVTSDSMCVDSFTASVSLYSKPKVGFITQDTTVQCFRGNVFLFSDTTLNNIGPLTRVWQLGDGDSSSALMYTHSYKKPGVYPVKLTVTSTKGCKDSLTRNITVVSTNAPAISGSNIVFTGDLITYTVPAIPGALYYWTVSGGSIISGVNTPIISVQWPSLLGAGTVKVEVYANGCLSDMASFPVTISDKALLNVTPVKVVFEDEGGSQNMLINSNVIWNISGVPAWFTLNKKTGSYTDSITITALPNTNSELREADITISITGDAKTVTIVQKGLQTGIHETLSKPSLIIFPNPTDNIVSLNFKHFDGVKKVSVYNHLGMLVKQLETSELTSDISLRDFAKGLYFIRVQSGNDVSAGTVLLK